LGDHREKCPRSGHVASHLQRKLVPQGLDGRFLWPGYGDNIRVLKWIFERLEGTAEASETPIGYVPAKDSIDISGLPDVQQSMDEILKVDPAEWRTECELIAEHQQLFGDRLPAEMKQQYENLVKRLG
jgi:phosphoenolpyruvate carboxykinase (GTP)